MTLSSNSNQSRSVNYNPYIHGTNSVTLSLLPKTNYQLMPILQMLDEFYTSPMVGELVLGGYSILGLDPLNESFVGAISFGNLTSKDYDLKKIIASYSMRKPQKEASHRVNFKNRLQYMMKGGFNQFDLFLIYFTRLRQMQTPVEQIISEEEQKLFEQQLNDTIQFYYFIQLIGGHIHPNFKALEEASATLKKEVILDAVRNELTMSSIIKNIKALNLDMRDIVADPTKDNLTKALQVLAVHQQAKTSSNTTIELPLTQFFSLDQPDYSLVKKPYFEDPLDTDRFDFFTLNYDTDNISFFLKTFLSGSLDPDYFSELPELANKFIAALEERMKLFEKLKNAPQDKFTLTDYQQASLSTNYPVIFVSESDKITTYGDEFRSNKPLKLGDDISMVATNTKENKGKLLKYLVDHQLSQVKLVSFSDLEQLRDDPSAPNLSVDSDALRTMLTNTKDTKSGALFFELFLLLDDLNDKRNMFRKTNTKAFDALNKILNEMNTAMNDSFATNKAVTGEDVRQFCQKSAAIINQQRSSLETHRGVQGVFDTLLTVLASLIVFYPAVYVYQKVKGIQHSFFKTDTAIRADHTLEKLNQITNASSEFTVN